MNQLKHLGPFTISLTLAIGAIGFSACGPAEPPPVVPIGAPSASISVAPITPPSVVVVDEGFRKTPPGPEGIVTYAPPKIEQSKLKNGVRILFVARHDLPIVAIHITSDLGASETKPGVASFMAAMLSQGTTKHDAVALSDAFERLGASYGAWASYDSTTLRGKSLKAQFPALCALLSEVWTKPAFDSKELDRERSKVLTSLGARKDSPGRLAHDATLSSLFPKGHPYSVTTTGEEADVKQISGPDLVAFHTKLMSPDHLIISVAGDTTLDQLTPLLEEHFGGLSAKPSKRVEIAPGSTLTKTSAHVTLIDRPGASQSQVQFVLPGVPRSSPDFAPILVMNRILGGAFASRMNLNLREKHAYTYGVGSGFEMLRQGGMFTAGGAIIREHTKDAVLELLSELQRIVKDKVTDEELADAKLGLIDQLPGRFQSVEDTVGSIAFLPLYGLPLDDWATRPTKYGAVTKEDVIRVAQTYLKGEQLRLIVVGDADKIESGLRDAALGKLEVRRAPVAKPTKTNPAKKP